MQLEYALGGGLNNMLLGLAELLERPALFKAAALCVLGAASTATSAELIEHVLAGLEARTPPQPESY